MKACYLDIADLRDVYISRAIDSRMNIKIDLAPYADEKLIARTDNVVRSHRSAIDGGEVGCDIGKQVGPENG